MMAAGKLRAGVRILTGVEELGRVCSEASRQGLLTQENCVGRIDDEKVHVY